MEKNEKDLKYRSCFDIIGPIMIGPSSSHTAGACAIGYACYKLLDNKVPSKVKITYYESFAATHMGHGTDFAIIGGLLGFNSADDRVPFSLEIARERGIEISFVESQEESPANHANTAYLELIDEDGNELNVLGISIGGGAIEICKIEKQGLILEPQETRNLIVMEWENQYNKQKFDYILEEFDLELFNYQEISVGDVVIVLFNPNRCLSGIELDYLRDNTNALYYKTLMDYEED